HRRRARLPSSRPAAPLREPPHPLSGEIEVHGGIGDARRRMAAPGVFPVDKPQAAAVIDEVFGKSIAVNEALRAEAGRFFKEPFDSPAFGAREPAAAWEREVAFADPDEV